MLKFLIDENIPKSVSLFLIKQKCDVKLARDIRTELTDKEILQIALKEKRIILSNDKDFIDLALNHKDLNIILFNFMNQGSDIRISALKKILPNLKGQFGILLLQE
jgi:predicted nuclease of predicted toxin-antitoxin system